MNTNELTPEQDSVEILEVNGLVYRSDSTVTCIDHMGDDDSVIRAAQVSVVGENDPNMSEKRRRGLINYLMANRHGSPFEHATITFYVNAPIFVFREFQRHRIASYNEMSGRYTKLEPHFYMPSSDRALVNAGSGAHPNLVDGTSEQYDLVVLQFDSVYQEAWRSYENLIAAGVANEVARSVLPVGTYSQMYVTMNLRSLMNFFSLRKAKDTAVFNTHPQREIEAVCEAMEDIFKERFPLIYETFEANGRVQP